MAPDLIQAISAFFPWGFVKVCILLLCLVYIVFAAIIVRQERLMSKVVEIPFMPVLRYMALVHFFTAVAVFFLSLIAL